MQTDKNETVILEGGLMERVLQAQRNIPWYTDDKTRPMPTVPRQREKSDSECDSKHDGRHGGVYVSIDRVDKRDPDERWAGRRRMGRAQRIYGMKYIHVPKSQVAIILCAVYVIGVVTGILVALAV